MKRRRDDDSSPNHTRTEVGQGSPKRLKHYELDQSRESTGSSRGRIPRDRNESGIVERRRLTSARKLEKNPKVVVELDPLRLEKRQKQIDFGKNTGSRFFVADSKQVRF